MPTLIESTADELREVLALIRSITDKAAEEDRELTDVEKDRILALGERRDKLAKEGEFLNDQVTRERAYSQLLADIDKNRSTDPPKRPTAQHPSMVGSGSLDVRGWGDLFTESDAFKAYPGGGTSARVDVPLNLETRAAITTATVPQQP